jgi:hypothetical protein
MVSNPLVFDFSDDHYVSGVALSAAQVLLHFLLKRGGFKCEIFINMN